MKTFRVHDLMRFNFICKITIHSLFGSRFWKKKNDCAGKFVQKSNQIYVKLQPNRYIYPPTSYVRQIFSLKPIIFLHLIVFSRNFNTWINHYRNGREWYGNTSRKRSRFVSAIRTNWCKNHTQSIQMSSMRIQLSIQR